MTATAFTFTQATKAGARARLLFIGPPGSGKTFTALRVATAFGGTVGVIDTDRLSASKYAHLFPHLTLPMGGTFDPADLTRACAVAADQGIDNLVVDTWSPFWSGPAGMLDKVDKAAASSGRGDKFTSGWSVVKPIERDMLDAMFGYPGNLIVTVRSKVEWLVERNEATGKSMPRRIGTKPDQRDGLETEFDLAGFLDDGTLVVTKSRIPALTGGVIHHPGEDLAVTVTDWLAADAVGAPFDPATVRDWVMAEGRTIPELRARFDALKATGQVGAVLMDGDEPVTLGVLIRRRRVELDHTTNGTTPIVDPL